MSLPTVSRLFRTALRTQLVSAANLTSKPAKHNITAGVARCSPATGCAPDNNNGLCCGARRILARCAGGDPPAGPRTFLNCEQAIAMTVMTVTILGPSSWVLAHLEDYKQK
ncbi:hypothetical protein INR49_025065 [Caranx melampygus]|nr:hypothetical protein INR49_025065 [Caranx melampygus]